MASDLKGGKVDTQNCKFISTKLSDSLRVGFAKSGDVLLSHKGTIGRSAILSTERDYVTLTPQVTGYRILDHSVSCNQFLRYYFMSAVFQDEFQKAAEGGATRAYIGITRQLDLTFRFPNVENQLTIARRLDKLMIASEGLACIYNKKLEYLSLLEQTILHSAFGGYV